MENNKYEKEFFSELVKNSNNLTDVAKKLNLKPFCGNRGTIKKYIKLYDLDVSHFRNVYENRIRPKRKLCDILLLGTTYDTTHLKNRLYDEGIKERVCELCGQNEIWYGNKMSLILDHINGINNDNRLENLRIVCPNCDATLPTFSGRNTSKCSIKSNLLKMENHYNYTKKGKSDCNSINQRKVTRPDYITLQNEIIELGYSGTGRKYGVSDNAIRKWVKYYKSQENNI